MSVLSESLSQDGEVSRQIVSLSEVQGVLDSNSIATQKEKITDHTKNKKSKATLKEPSSAATQLDDEPRKSSRDRRPTHKMIELIEQESIQKERKFNSVYEKWKTQVKNARTNLKQACSESDLYDMMDVVEELESELKELYDYIRLKNAPSQEIRRKIDASVAVTADLLGLMRVRLIEGEENFDGEAERARLRMLIC